MYLKNASGEVRNYTVQVDFEGGSYVLGQRELDPGETFALDLRELRDGGEPDPYGTTIPPDAASGQVRWSMIGAENHTMVGRAEYVDRVHGLASTFACSNCCPDSFAGGWIDPGGFWVPVHTFLQLHAFQLNTDCYGTYLIPNPVPPLGWGSTHPGVLTVDSAGAATGVSPGTAEAQATWKTWVWWYQGGYPVGECRSQQITVSPRSQATTWDFSISAADQVYPSQTSGSSSTQVTVQLTPQVSGFQLDANLEIIRIGSTGGHGTAGACHPTPSPPVRGQLANTQGTMGSGTNWRFQTQFAAGTAAGVEQIKATVGNRVRLKDIEVRVPDLINLGDGPNLYLKREDLCHDNGDYHYGTYDANLAVISAANHFWNNRGKNLSPQEKMVVNDQSLKWGGLFDIAGDWSTNPGHTTHREGRHVDIPYRVHRNGALSPPLPESDDSWQALDEALGEAFGQNGCAHHGTPSPNHWHCHK